MIQLRDYQEEIVNGIRKSFANKNKRVILCAPTGSGKTVMFTYNNHQIHLPTLDWFQN
jgi:superfamily II DNA or RNA helicase